VVRGTTDPAPADLLTPVVWAMAGDNKQFDHRPPRPVYSNCPKIESGPPMVTPDLPWKFHANRSSRFLVIADKETKKQTKKEIARKQYPVPLPGAG